MSNLQVWFTMERK